MGVAKKAQICDIAGAEFSAIPQACPAKGEPVQIAHRKPTFDDVEAMMLAADQVDCPVKHHFGPGVYVREAFLPAGTYVMGHAHKHEHMNIMISGKMAVIVNGDARIIEGPCVFNGEPGRKFAYIIEDTVFQNVYATSETDLDVIEDMFVDKSAAWANAQEQRRNEVAIDMAVRQYIGGSLS